MLQSYLMNPEAIAIIKDVHSIFKEKGLTLSLAESCTGGLISHMITTLPGASDFFQAGVVTYSGEAKTEILGISRDVFTNSGVVSEAFARVMAERVRLLANTDFSVSTTGNLGPDVLENKETGLIYIAASKEGKTVSRELRLKGNRENNKHTAAFETLKLLIEFIEGKQELLSSQ